MRAICDSLREDVADFANQLCRASLCALDDAETAADARAVVVLVEQHTGMRQFNVDSCFGSPFERGAGGAD